MNAAIVYVALIAAVLAGNVAYGRLRAAAPRRSHAWFGCLVAPVALLIALRVLLGLSWTAWTGLAVATVAGHWLGRWTGARERAPAPARWRFAAYAGLTGALLLAIGQPLHAADDPHAAHRAAAGSGYHRLDASEPAPGFDLVNQNGRRVRLADMRGHTVVLTFLFTSCTDVCPTLVHTLQQVERQLAVPERDKVRFVGITIDPKRDTPAQLTKFMSQRRLDARRWSLLTGAVEPLTRVADDYGVVVRPAPRGDFVHNSVFVVIDPQGIERVEFHGVATPPQEIAAAVRAAAISPAGQ